MAADPGRAVLEGIEALGVPELHVFLLRLGIDGRGLDPDRLCDIAVEALRLVTQGWHMARMRSR